mgnify:CR=1 FL=1
MLPTNSGHAKDQGCSPVSSNCVVWQGPSLECIDLCKGDTVSDVVAKMALELCTIIEQFELEAYDFSCLAVPVSEQPSNMAGLIQILIERICELEGVTPGSTDPSSDDCPTGCIVTLASCFEFTDPSTGDPVTTLPLIDYVTAIGNQVCENITSITSLQDQINTLDEDINGTSGVAGKVEVLETDKADISSLQYEVNVKTDPAAGVKYITSALRSVENSLIGTQDALGSATDIYTNVIKEGNIGNEAKMLGIGNMKSITGWTDEVQKAAESLGNLWLAVDDLRQAVTYMIDNSYGGGCSDLYLNFRTTLDVQVLSTILTIYTDGSTGFTDQWKECGNGLTSITISDSVGNSTTLSISVIDLIDNPSGYQVDLTPTTIDPTKDITSVAHTCFENTVSDTTCEKDYSYANLANPVCPATVITAFATSVAYTFTPSIGYSYIVNLYYAGSSSPVVSQIISTPGVIVSNSISGLVTETDYELEVVTVDSMGGETPCPKEAFATLSNNCDAPINSTAILTI